MGLLEEWAAWREGSPPHILDADRSLLASDRSRRELVTINGWGAAHTGDDFCAPGDHRVHLGLLPQPFCGDLRRASIYVLLVNPGIGNTDYFGEYEVPEYRAALLYTLRQVFPAGTTPFLFLNPRFAWHGGFKWWHGKLARVIASLSNTWGVPFAAARARLGASTASIELFPYHSASFRDRAGWIRHLPSVELARAFVHEIVLPRVRTGEAIALVMRQARAWDLPDEPGVIRYTAGEARGAHLTPGSQGGRAILDHLLRVKG